MNCIGGIICSSQLETQCLSTPCSHEMMSLSFSSKVYDYLLCLKSNQSLRESQNKVLLFFGVQFHGTYSVRRGSAQARASKAVFYLTPLHTPFMLQCCEWDTGSTKYLLIGLQQENKCCKSKKNNTESVTHIVQGKNKLRPNHNNFCGLVKLSGNLNT